MTRNVSYETPKGKKVVKISNFPDKCPICHNNISPLYIGTRPVTDFKIQVVYQCTNAECRSLFIGYYSRNAGGDYYYFKQTRPNEHVEEEFPDEVMTVSPEFVKIYNEAFFAESNNLSRISGIGYRKALEFLIKDYLISIYPEQEKTIKTKSISQCISQDIENTQIKEIAKRAIWIGNDEAHYMKKWEDKDVNDLKKLIKISVHYITMEIASKKYIEEMA